MEAGDRKGVGELPAWLAPALPEGLDGRPTRTIGFSGRQADRIRARKKPTVTGCMAAVREFLKAQPPGTTVVLGQIVKATGHGSAPIGSALSKLMARQCVTAVRNGRANSYSWSEGGVESRPYRHNK